MKFDPKLSKICGILNIFLKDCEHNTKQLQNSSRFLQNHGSLAKYWRTLARQTFQYLLHVLNEHYKTSNKL